MTPQEKGVTDLISPVAEASGYEVIRLRITGTRTKTVQLMAETPEGTMTVEDCATLSRALSPVLEAADPIDGQWVLEVSSPGIDRPLTRLKDFARWEGFAAKLELAHAVEGQKRFRGTLAGTEEEDVLIDLDGEDDTAVIPFSLIASAKLMLTDELVTESLRRAKAEARAPEDATDNENDEPSST